VFCSSHLSNSSWRWKLKSEFDPLKVLRCYVLLILVSRILDLMHIHFHWKFVCFIDFPLFIYLYFKCNLVFFQTIIILIIYEFLFETWIFIFLMYFKILYDFMILRYVFVIRVYFVFFVSCQKYIFNNLARYINISK